jgi:hypothetical protein
MGGYGKKMKAAIERETTEAFRVATECGCGLTKGSNYPVATVGWRVVVKKKDHGKRKRGC